MNLDCSEGNVDTNISWMIPHKIDKNSNTCFKSPNITNESHSIISNKSHAARNINISRNVGENCKACDFKYYPGVLFGMQFQPQ